MTIAIRTGFLEERAGAGEVSVGSLVVMPVEAFPHLCLPIHSAKFTAAFSVPQRAHGPVHKVQHNMIQDEVREAWEVMHTQGRHEGVKTHNREVVKVAMDDLKSKG